MMSILREEMPRVCDLSVADLRQINKELCAEIRSRAGAEAMLAGRKFLVGDVVALTSKGTRRLPGGSIGRILSKGPKNLIVDFGLFGEWRVNGTALRVAVEGEKVTEKIDFGGGVDYRMERGGAR